MTGDRGIPRSFPFAGDITAVRDSHIISVVGRLAPGVTREQAQAQLTSVMAELSQRYPDTNAGLGANVVPLHEEIVGDMRPLILLLQIAVAVLLLIACANVAHLLLGQAAGRQAEIAMRVALGADRSRIVRQLLVETLIIAVPGGIAGLGAGDGRRARAWWPWRRPNLPRLEEIRSMRGAGVHAGDDAADGDRVRSRAGDADGAHVGQRSRRRSASASPATARVRRGHQALVDRRAGAGAGAAGRRGTAAREFRARDATSILALPATIACSRSSTSCPTICSRSATTGLIDPSRKIRFINSVLDSVRGGRACRPWPPRSPRR